MPEWVRMRMRSGEQLVGTFQQLPLTSVCDVLVGSRAFDVLCVEGEHSGLDRAAIAALVRSVDLQGLPCLVRVAACDPVEVAFALDAGAAGVLVPRVESADQAAAVVAWSHFPPVGVRGLGPGRATGYGALADAYVAEARENTLVCVQVETRAGVERLDEILAVEGLDLVFVGVGDLALSMGLEGASDLRVAAEGVVERVLAAAKLAGVFAASASDASYWIGVGVSLVLFGSDLGFLRAGIASELSRMSSG